MGFGGFERHGKLLHHLLEGLVHLACGGTAALFEQQQVIGQVQCYGEGAQLAGATRGFLQFFVHQGGSFNQPCLVFRGHGDAEGVLIEGNIQGFLAHGHESCATMV